MSALSFPRFREEDVAAIAAVAVMEVENFLETGGQKRGTPVFELGVCEDDFDATFPSLGIGVTVLDGIIFVDAIQHPLFDPRDTFIVCRLDFRKAVKVHDAAAPSAVIRDFETVTAFHIHIISPLSLKLRLH